MLVNIFLEFGIPSFVFNVLSSLVSSFIFIFALLFFMKPNFDIVPFIAKSNNDFDDTDDISHAFKIINKSFFGAYDISVKANYYTIQQGENGIVNKIFTKIELKNDSVNYIPKFKIFKKNYGDNCVQFFTYENLEKELKKNSVNIQFQVTARHSLTGLNNIFTYEFVSAKSIKEGKFKEGNFKEVI